MMTELIKGVLACLLLALPLPGVRAQEAEEEPQPADELHSTPAGAQPDLVIADFEGDDFGAWTTEGDAFGTGPASGGLDGQMPVAGFAGRGLANSFHGGDGAQGKLISPPFTIRRPYINLLVGGGSDGSKVRAELVIDEQVVRKIAGENRETLGAATWDVTEFAGKPARLMIIDEHTGGWGHLLVDQVTQSEVSSAPILVSRERRFGPITARQRYLNLPVKTGAPKRRMILSAEGHTMREFDIELSQEPDFWAFTDLFPFQGKAITLTVNALDRDSKVMDLVETAETLRHESQIYREALRPQFHFSTKRGWINDPNGLVYLKGQYHLFYQHNPYGWNWGNMHWGHAVSPDLVHWEQLPIALYPRAYGDWAFSGGALIDAANTSGFKTGVEDVMVTFYTSTGRGECVVYSNDMGLTWTEYEGNPVVKHRGRDPKVIWHERTRQWVMALYDEHESERCIAFYTSPNLKDWTFQSRIAGFYECPEIFQMDVDLNPTQPKWVIYAANGDYMLGSFDGKTFSPSGKKIRGNYGNCFYASQMYSNLPKYDGRHIQVGWGRIAMPGMPFNQQMLFPCELHLRTTDDGPRLHTTPVREIARLYRSSELTEHQTLSAMSTLGSGELLDIDVTIDVSRAEKLAFDVRGTAVTLDLAQGELSCMDKRAPLNARDGLVSIRMLIDRASIEIYGNRGRVYMPIGGVLDAGKMDVTLAVEGSATIKHMRVSPLKSIWR